jgi:recombinational DNA repair protein (RecF pathway)
MIWHDFVKLFEPHLRDAGELDRFYYDLLLTAARHWHRQNPKRIVVESYHALLQHEGRLHPSQHCYICEQPIQNAISLMTAFHPAHPECIYSPALEKKIIDDFFVTGKTLYMEDEMVEQLYGVVLKGL